MEVQTQAVQAAHRGKETCSGLSKIAVFRECFDCGEFTHFGRALEAKQTQSVTRRQRVGIGADDNRRVWSVMPSAADPATAVRVHSAAGFPEGRSPPRSLRWADHPGGEGPAFELQKETIVDSTPTAQGPPSRIMST